MLQIVDFVIPVITIVLSVVGVVINGIFIYLTIKGIRDKVLPLKVSAWLRLVPSSVDHLLSLLKFWNSGLFSAVEPIVHRRAYCRTHANIRVTSSIRSDSWSEAVSKCECLRFRCSTQNNFLFLFGVFCCFLNVREHNFLNSFKEQC